jgi:hypothetical protein
LSKYAYTACQSIFVEKIPLTPFCDHAYKAAMNYPTPEQIEFAAAEAGLTMVQVFERSGVSRESFYRAKRGAGNMTPRTAIKLRKAVEELRA